MSYLHEVYRIFNPEEYVLNSNACCYFENKRLIFRSEYHNCEIDFTDKKHYDDFIIKPIDKNLPIRISPNDLESISEIQNSIDSERKLKVFRKPLEETSITDYFEPGKFEITANTQEVCLLFHVGYCYYVNTPPTFVLHSNGNVDLNYSEPTYNFNKFNEKLYNTIKLKIRNMSEILRDSYLDINEALMDDALE